MVKKTKAKEQASIIMITTLDEAKKRVSNSYKRYIKECHPGDYMTLVEYTETIYGYFEHMMSKELFEEFENWALACTN